MGKDWSPSLRSVEGILVEGTPAMEAVQVIRSHLIEIDRIAASLRSYLYIIEGVLQELHDHAVKD
jgi:hypothetical protein